MPLGEQVRMTVSNPLEVLLVTKCPKCKSDLNNNWICKNKKCKTQVLFTIKEEYATNKKRN